MKSKVKKTLKYSVTTVILLGAAFYASMEEYQKDNLSRFLEQVIAPS
ncbi:hypothetical protein [Pseudoalteromonas luteoviolacea]|uniref:Uncharacterized protein n=1 Tax=Pseudoalteromonas luteoviolacea NCIMB 1942 TaxID=1365253 RepID=A0A166Y9D5_9GAMM|nr:hypothetical protein [Pseudoalteromonas luteoviolacea]KZN41587.1 hypothetical protein N482_20125 [Pseudoalteromonas luteoviolacea NCIMB 1942]